MVATSQPRSAACSAAAMAAYTKRRPRPALSRWFRSQHLPNWTIWRRLVTVPAMSQTAYRTWQPQAEGDITVRWEAYIVSGSDRPLSGSIFWIPDGQCEFQIGDSNCPGQMA